MVSQPKRMQRSAKRELSREDFDAFVRQYVEEKKFAETATARVNEKKAAINTFVDKYGDVDDKGSKYIDVEGVDGVGAVKRERRVSTSLDEERATAWLKKHKLWEKFSVEVPAHRELDTDALDAAAYTGEIPEETVESFHVVSEVWALRMVK